MGKNLNGMLYGIIIDKDYLEFSALNGGLDGKIIELSKDLNGIIIEVNGDTHIYIYTYIHTYNP